MTRRMLSRPTVVVGAALAAVLVLNGVALAYRMGSVSPTGTGSATTPTGSITLTITGSSTAGLYPGGPAGSATVEVENAYDRAITLTALTAGAPVITNASGCTNADVSVASPANTFPHTLATTASHTWNVAVTMGMNAQNACQGATITIPFTASGKF